MTKDQHSVLEEHRKKMRSKSNKLWIASTFILLAVVVLLLIKGGFLSNTLSEKEVSEKVTSYLNKNILVQGIEAQVQKTSKINNCLYKVNLNVGPQAFESYVSADGKYIFPSAMDTTETPATEEPKKETAKLDMKVLADDDTVEGDANAPVTIVEWSDYQCPYCKKFYQDTYGKIKTEYIDTGKVKFIYRDFPLGFHEFAQKAAEAAECAGEQGQYWKMGAKLFEEGVNGADVYKKYAKDLGLDTAKFNICLDTGAMASEVKKDMEDGTKIGVTGTPAFVINGQIITGAQPFENFKKIIDAELQKK